MSCATSFYTTQCVPVNFTGTLRLGELTESNLNVIVELKKAGNALFRYRVAVGADALVDIVLAEENAFFSTADCCTEVRVLRETDFEPVTWLYEAVSFDYICICFSAYDCDFVQPGEAVQLEVQSVHIFPETTTLQDQLADAATTEILLFEDATYYYYSYTIVASGAWQVDRYLKANPATNDSADISNNPAVTTQPTSLAACQSLVYG